MRKAEIITIDGKAVTVRELCVSQLPAAAGVFAGLLQVDPGNPAVATAWLHENISAATDILVGCTSLGEEFREVGGSAMCDIVEAFVRVNAAFFARARSLPGVLAAAQKPENPAP